MDDAEVEHGLNALQTDLGSGRWDKRHGHLREATPEIAESLAESHELRSAAL